MKQLLINNPLRAGFLSSKFSVLGLFTTFCLTCHPMLALSIVHDTGNTMCLLLKLWKRAIKAVKVQHSFVSCSLQTPTQQDLITKSRKKAYSTKRVSPNEIINSHLAMFQSRQSRKYSQQWHMNSSYAICREFLQVMFNVLSHDFDSLIPWIFFVKILNHEERFD